jgi:signal transduction histidine kinase
VDQAKTEFVSLASHQLRTPLTTVNWYSEMLLTGDVGPLNEKQREYLNEIYKGSKRMGGLVNALLDVSRMEMGTFIVEPEPTDIPLLARSVVSELQPQLDQKSLQFIAKYADNLPIMNADPKLLRMVLQNLLANAVKYTPPKGQIKLELNLATARGQIIPTQGPGSNILIKVSDTGYGIPRANQDKIFTKLFRADNVRAKDTEGTGLGLYIVKGIVDQAGGQIWFESEENQGATFYVTLPLAGMKKKSGTKTLA